MTIKEYGEERAIQGVIEAYRDAGFSEERIREYIKRKYKVDDSYIKELMNRVSH